MRPMRSLQAASDLSPSSESASMPNILNDKLFESMDSSVLPVDAAVMLPPSIYTEPEFFEFEKDAIFAKEWLCVGRKEWIPNPGDYFTSMHMGEPIVIVRGRDNVIRSMPTVCQHRAMLVAEGHGNTRAFLCPYHHWAYSLTGDLIGAPAIARACDFAKTKIKLLQFQVKEWLGFLFINFDFDAAPLAPRLEKLTEVLALMTWAMPTPRWTSPPS